MSVTPIRQHAPRTLPHNLNAEASVLGGLILRDSLLLQLEHLEPDDFYDHKHKIIFQAMRNLEARRTPLDVVTIENEVQKAGKLDAIGGPGYLGELALLVPTADNVEHYAKQVRVLARNRRAILTLADSLERAYGWSGDEASELIDSTVAELQRFDEHRRDGAALQWTTPITEYLGDSEPSDDDAEDWIIRDLIPRGEPWLLGGPAKSGKTWMALDLMLALALGEDWCGFLNTLGKPARVIGIFREDGKRRLHKRPWELARARMMSFHHPAFVENLRISREPVYLPDTSYERRLIAEARAFKADVIVVDNLTRVMTGATNDEEDVKDFTRSWGEIGDKTGAAVGFLHHVRKSGGDQGRGGDPFEALRGAGDILGFARHAIVVSPRREETERLSEVRMRGNIDLTKESFVLGFERNWSSDTDKWRAKFHHRGDIEKVREERATQKKEADSESKKQALIDRETRDLKTLMDYVHRNGTITAKAFATQLGLSSPRGRPADIIQVAINKRLLVACGGSEKNLGYRRPEDVQPDMKGLQ